MEWHLHLDVLVFLLIAGGAYLWGLARLRPRPVWLHPVEARQVGLFSLGLLVICAAEATPLHELSEHYLFSAHMVQHILITLIAPPLLLAGIPAWLARPLVRRRFVFPVASVLTLPIVAIVLFNGVLALWHVPQLYEATLQNHTIHILNHIMYVATAVLLWWPIFSPLPELPRLGYPLQMLYLFIQSLLPAILASMITFSTDVLYPTYAAAPRLWDIPPLQDQQIGGLIMKVVGGLILWVLAAVIFFFWFNHEEAEVEKSWD